MGKRSNFERKPKDFYVTPETAVHPLLSHQEPCRFIEPCAGDGSLTKHLKKHGFVCVGEFDIEPKSSGICEWDTINDGIPNVEMADVIITNPPWSRNLLHKAIAQWVEYRKPIWLLFDSDWAHTKQSIDYQWWLTDIVSVGRVKWFPDTNTSGKDNVCWYRFYYFSVGSVTFHGPRRNHHPKNHPR